MLGEVRKAVSSTIQIIDILSVATSQFWLSRMLSRTDINLIESARNLEVYFLLEQLIKTLYILNNSLAQPILFRCRVSAPFFFGALIGKRVGCTRLIKLMNGLHL